MNYNDLKNNLKQNTYDEIISKVICKQDVKEEKNRYIELLDKAYKDYGDGDYHFVSSPGRSEIGGNHTDHQHGHVICASLSLDNLCVFKSNNSNFVVFKDPLFNEVRIDISDLKIHDDEKNTSSSLIRGIASRIKELGFNIGGFDALCNSRVLVGASISSSACFEIMIVEIFNSLFNEGKIDNVQRALIGQYAENNYFGKPSGLLDQLAISAGGFTAIDFKNPEKPIINSYDFNFDDYGYKFLIINTKGDHANLTDEYAAIPNECKAVAKELGKDVLCDSDYQNFLKNIKGIRNTLKNDRALMRAIHIFGEDKRAILEKEAIEKKDIKTLLQLMTKSGQSSYMYLQNCYASSNPKSQGISLALGLSDMYLNGEGAYRVQGGGFEGTIVAVVPKKITEEYSKLMNSVFGEDSILDVSIRSFGTKTII